jgi:hypothetical protein
LSAMLAGGDLQSIRDAYESGWPGVWRAAINPRKCSEGYVVGAALPPPWQDCVKARAVLVEHTGRVTGERAEVHHIASGTRVCGPDQKLDAAYRARFEQALMNAQFETINP